MIKAYLIYLNDTKELYAITDDKTKYKLFVAQRNKQLFHIKKVKMTSDEFDNLVYKNKQLLLNDSFLDDGETRMKIVDTIYEEDTLSMVCEVIYNRITRIQKMFENTHLDEKYLKIISEATTIISGGGNYIEIDTFALFYYLFKYTFEDVSKIDTVKEITDKFIKEL